MLKFIRKSKLRLYIFLFILLFIWFMIFDYLNEGQVNALVNAFKALFFIAVHLFFTWAWDSKEYNKKEK